MDCICFLYQHSQNHEIFVKVYNSQLSQTFILWQNITLMVNFGVGRWLQQYGQQMWFVNCLFVYVLSKYSNFIVC